MPSRASSRRGALALLVAAGRARRGSSPPWSERSSHGQNARRNSWPRPVGAPRASRGAGRSRTARRALAERGLEAASVSGDGAVELPCHTVLGLSRGTRRTRPSAFASEQSSAIASALGREGGRRRRQDEPGIVAFDAGDPDRPSRLWEDVLATTGRTGMTRERLRAAQSRLAAYHLERVEEKRERFREAETLFARIGFREHFAHALQGIAAVDAAEGHALSAARLLGRAKRLLAETGAAETNFDAALPREAEASARAQLGDEAFDVAFAPTGLDAELEPARCPTKPASDSDGTSPSTSAVNHPLGDRSSSPSGAWCAQRNTQASRASCGGLEGLHGERGGASVVAPLFLHSLRRQRKRGYVE